MLRGASAAALGSACFIAALAAAQPTPAQTASGAGQTTAPAPGADDSIAEVVVTASRVDRKGFEAPTPTTVIGPVELREGARPNIAAVLDDLPQIKPTLNPGNTYLSAVQSGAQSVDLRGLGPTRTLVLLNGHRFVGDGDLNTVPLDLVQRVEVVTGGASADWGSGAVAGVVNIILNDKLQGGQFTVQGGISSRGDGDEYRVSGIYGFGFANGRGHVLLDAEYYDSDGIFPRTSRTNVGGYAVLANPGYTATNGQHAYLIAPNVGATNASPGGLITSGALAGNAFNPDGTLHAFSYGTLRGASLSSGGETPSNDALEYLTAPVTRYNLYSRATYDLTDRIQASADIRFTNTFNNYVFAPDQSLGNITIRADNAFLPTAVSRALAAAGQTSFTLGRINSDFENRQYAYTRKDLQATFALNGRLDGSWRWDAYYTHGERTVQEKIYNGRIVANFNLAVDAVVSPATGQPICRVALTNPSTTCVPVNLFGFGAPSQAAANYINGLAFLKTRQRLDTGAATLHGEPLSLWAGPISIAVGVEARREAIQTVHDDAVSVASGFTNVNPKGFDGSFSVREAFGEVVVPLLKDVPFFKLAEFNGAARISDYSNSGDISAYKLGFTDRITDDLLFRLVQSRDTRSASLTELFTFGTSSTAVINDPVTKTQYTVTALNGGNAALQPEVSDTTTVGLTYSPGWAPGLSLSLDHYDINIDGAIATLSGQDIVTRCFNGNAALCPLITRTNGVITRIQSTFINLANYQTSGIDVEASYTLPLGRLWSPAPGRVLFRGLANHVESLRTNDGVTRVQYVGVVGTGVSFGQPEWRATASATYQLRDLNIDLRVRYMGGGTFNPALDIANNHVSSRTYVDLSVEKDVPVMRGQSITLFGSIDNLFDKDPPIAANPQFYDIVGRYFNFGVKKRF